MGDKKDEEATGSSCEGKFKEIPPSYGPFPSRLMERFKSDLERKRKAAEGITDMEMQQLRAQHENKYNEAITRRDKLKEEERKRRHRLINAVVLPMWRTKPEQQNASSD
jgi:hypothetical protein